MKMFRLSAVAAAVLPTLFAVMTLAPTEPRAQVRLPALGEAVSEDFPVGTEHKLGEQIMREIWIDPDYVDDPLLFDYLEGVWQPLVAATRRLGNIEPDMDALYPWEPFLVRDRSINAFALPGGYIGVHLGLIAMTTTRDELAAVLAHELSHITQRHIARGMVSAQHQSILGLAAMILGVIAAGKSGSPNGVQAVLTGGQAAMAQGQLNFSRDVEREADRVGYTVLVAAGFSPAGMATMFERLEEADHLNDDGSYPYLRNHPLTAERIGDARARAAIGKPIPQSSPLLHEEMRARALVLADPREPSLRRVQATDKLAPDATPSQRLNALYASALASSMLRDFVRSDAALAQALAVERGSPMATPEAERTLRWLQEQTWLARGDSAKALAQLPSFADDKSRAAMLMRAQVATAAAAAHVADAGPAERQSLEALQTWVSLNRLDAGVWTQLAQTSEQMGLPLRALRAEGESHAAIGDLNGAIDRLRAGQRLSRNAPASEFFDASILESRLRDLEGQRRQLLADMRSEHRVGQKDPDE